MIPFPSQSIALAILAALCPYSQQARYHQSPMPVPATSAAYAGVERHPAIHRAIRSLEAAKAYIEAAQHDFCGHRVAALAESNLALNELGLAVICDKRRDKSTGRAFQLSASSSVATPVAFAVERHPLIRQAIDALQIARRDLNNASHHYCGHRIEALEAVNRALAQLRLAIDCDQG